MKTIVLILPKLTVKVNVRALKNRIHAYVGDRMIKEKSDEMPALVLKGELTDEDKRAITNFCEDCGVIFISYENEDNFNHGDYYLDFEI